MSDDKGQHEPTMEEILASIRRIISEDDEPKARPAEPEAEPEAEAPPPPPPPPPPKAAAPPPEPEPAPLEDIFELTKVVEDDGDIVDMAEPEPEPEPIPMAMEEDDLLVMEDEPEPMPVMAAPAPAPPREYPPLPPVPDLALPEGLMGANSAQNAAKALYVLQSGLPMYGPEGPRTLEVLVEDVLRPMLKAWLDDNLPPLVERLVQTEIDRLSRRGGRS